jgi:hypothetical protein
VHLLVKRNFDVIKMHGTTVKIYLTFSTCLNSTGVKLDIKNKSASQQTLQDDSLVNRALSVCVCSLCVCVCVCVCVTTVQNDTECLLIQYRSN